MIIFHLNQIICKTLYKQSQHTINEQVMHF